MGAAAKNEYDHFVGGTWRRSGSGKTIDVLNPATGELLTRVPAGDSRDVDAAVAAAREAFVTWGRPPPSGDSGSCWKSPTGSRSGHGTMRSWKP